LTDNLTSQRCYNLFSDLHIPILVDLSFTSSAIGFESWWSMWKTHVFRRALGPMLQQIHAEYEALEEEVSHQFSTSSWLCSTLPLIPFVFSVAGRWSVSDPGSPGWAHNVV
jgi:hypothetical protein